jgi:twitching motility two-component system response regulator PilG
MQSIRSQHRYQAQQIPHLLENMQDRHVSGMLCFTANLNIKLQERSRFLILRKGEIVYGGASIPNNEAFAKKLGQNLGRGLVETAVNFALPKLANKSSVRELLELMVRLRTVTWVEIETFVEERVAQTIEQLLPYPGQYCIEEDVVAFDLTPTESGRGLDWTRLRTEIDRRQQIWQSFSPLIPSMDAIPQLPENRFAQVTDSSVRQQLQQQVDGKRSLFEIAEQLGQDPLELGRSYLMWAEAGWVTCNGVESSDATISTSHIAETSRRPIILSVDDSPIVQVTVKRILSDRYEVMLANNAIAALNVLNANPVALLLLDVTMPDIDGLEFCKTLRGIPKFKNLPIIMLTAKDSLVDKCQGFIAGSNQYLYKPIEAAKLLEVVGSYVS